MVLSGTQRNLICNTTKNTISNNNIESILFIVQSAFKLIFIYCITCYKLFLFALLLVPSSYNKVQSYIHFKKCILCKNKKTTPQIQNNKIDQNKQLTKMCVLNSPKLKKNCLDD